MQTQTIVRTACRRPGDFRGYDLVFVHIDIKHLPKLQTDKGERPKRYLYVVIDRCSRSVHLAVKDDETEKSAIAFRREAASAFSFPLTHVLTDNGSCFTLVFAKVCTGLVRPIAISSYGLRKPTAWWSASMAASAAKCWASTSTRIVLSSRFCAASTLPTTCAANVCSLPKHQTTSCRNVWLLSVQQIILTETLGQGHAT
jgi:hypothetical protein